MTQSPPPDIVVSPMSARELSFLGWKTKVVLAVAILFCGSGLASVIPRDFSFATGPSSRDSSEQASQQVPQPGQPAPLATISQPVPPDPVVRNEVAAARASLPIEATRKDDNRTSEEAAAEHWPQPDHDGFARADHEKGEKLAGEAERPTLAKPDAPYGKYYPPPKSESERTVSESKETVDEEAVALPSRRREDPSKMESFNGIDESLFLKITKEMTPLAKWCPVFDSEPPLNQQAVELENTSIVPLDALRKEQAPAVLPGTRIVPLRQRAYFPR